MLVLSLLTSVRDHNGLHECHAQNEVDFMLEGCSGDSGGSCGCYHDMIEKLGRFSLHLELLKMIIQSTLT